MQSEIEVESSLPARARIRVVRIAAVATTVAIFFAAAVWAQPILMPLALAVLLHLALAPLVRALKRFRIPAFAGAFLVVGAGVAAIATLVMELAGPAQQWLKRMPEAFARFEERLRALREPMRGIAQASESVQKMAGDDPSTALKVAVVESGTNSMLIARTGELLGLTAMTVLLLYFLLASDGAFLRRFVRVLPRLSDKKRAVETARNLEHDVSRYFSTFFGISVGLGVAEGVAMALLGMPNPALWGLMAMVLSWIPYAGALVGSAVVALVASATFEGTGHALLVPLIFYSLTAVEGTFVTPLIMGRRLTLNPVIGLVWVALWLWMWGVVGAFIALPMLAAVRIVASKASSLGWLSELLSAGETPCTEVVPQPSPEVVARCETG